ncbi:U32 family peptidase [Verrucomicrobiaceae bacterium N1E253]|uniref:U32 family peptidase n=1 Tax=Oceaniferula marina TaxID=2748318 RepID=A0A851GNW9_9BACT|nr:peptidase U32 family protein [Oceaniferula marina]NWK57551.1 U32 family peptidase [Oceaniferula marina]
MEFKEPIELLAPAGCFPSLQAAIDNGADAVYFGLAQLNMRARSRRSFNVPDLKEIMSRLHAAKVKGYLTLNTLLYEHDLKLCQKMLETAKAEKVDGVILSDMAAVQMANELDLEVHLSTQLSLSNFESVRFYAPYCDRVVLARELNLKMIRSIYDKINDQNLRGRDGRPMEIEAFAHGALCIAVSGRCGMSLFNSNASANRGACEQNCRKEYIMTSVEDGKQLKLDNNFIMSPNDIATIDFMDQFLESGVRVLKIEGRGRSPEYVAAVIRAYRKAVDAVVNGTFTPKLVDQLYPELEGVFNRGLSSGYYLGRDQGWAADAGNKSKRRKVLVGKVSHAYPKAGVVVIDAAASPLSRGESFLVIGNSTGVIEGEVNDLRAMQDNGEMLETEHGQKGQTLTLKINAKARLNDKVYKVVEA